MALLRRLLLIAGTLLPSTLRLALWRLLGFEVGHGCRVAMFSVVVADRIEIGPGAVVEALTLIYRPVRLTIGERCRVASFVRVIGFTGEVTLRPQSFLGLGCLIDCSEGFELGRRSQIGPRCMFYTHGASALIFNARYPHRNGPIRIGADCWIAMGVVVHPRTQIGRRSVVLPGLTVRGDVDEGTLLLPPEPEHRRRETRLLQLTVSDADRRGALDDAFHRLARACSPTHVDDGDEAVWTLALPRSRALHWMRSEGATLDGVGPSTRHRVVWTLKEREDLDGIPQFCFERLVVVGPWTPFAEHVAGILCAVVGAQFVFAERPFPGIED